MTRPEDREALDALAAALQAPGRPSELSGLASALAEYRGADEAAAPAADRPGSPRRRRAPGAPGTSGTPRAPHRSRTPRRRPLIGVLAAVLLIAAGTNAAQRGSLPAPAQQFAHTVLGGLGVQTPGRPRPHASQAVEPAPDLGELLGLCRLLADGDYDLHTRTIDPTARKELSKAAGAPGDDARIVPYCIGLLAAYGQPTGSPPTGTSPSAVKPPTTPPQSTRQPSPAPPRATDRTHP